MINMLTFYELGEVERKLHDVEALNKLISETYVYGMMKLKLR